MKKFYEVILWNAGDDRVLGYFNTVSEANECIRRVMKEYIRPDEELLERYRSGLLGIDTVERSIGMTSYCETLLEIGGYDSGE